jgi:hypothetical protein
LTRLDRSVKTKQKLIHKSGDQNPLKKTEHNQIKVATTQNKMKKLMTIFGAILFASVILTSCGKKASEYEKLTKEYKNVLCIGMGNWSSLSDKTKALQRQLELNKEYEEALKSLPQDEKAKLMMSWANIMAEVADGKCD